MIDIRPGSLRSAVHVIFQFALIALIYISGSAYPKNYVLLSLYILLIFTGLWSMYLMKFRFNVSPEPLKGISILSKGPYRVIRHPMYTSVLGMTLCLVAGEFSYARIAYWALLAVNMFLKLSYEEKLLSAAFPSYADYMKRTKRLIPYIF